MLGAIPTVVLLALLYCLYHVIVHKPLEAILAERRKRTQGAVDQARADIGLAAARTAEYEGRLREAHIAVFKALDQRRKQATEARDAALNQARECAQQLIAQAKSEIELECTAARATLATDSERIASQIIATLLQPAVGGPATTVGGR